MEILESDRDGNLLIHDSEYNIVYILNSEGILLNRISYSDTYNNFSSHVAVDNEKRIIISSWYLKKVFIYNFDGQLLSVFTRANTLFGSVDTDLSDNIYILSNTGIIVFNKNGVFQKTIGEFGTGDNQLSSPADLAIDDDKIFVSDRNRVHVYSTAGEYLYHFDFSGTLNLPGDIAIHPNGLIYVSNSSYHRIDIFSLLGTPAGSLGTVGVGDGEMDGVTGISIDSDGNIYQADFASKIQVFTSTGVFIKKIGTSFSQRKDVLHFPSSIDFDNDGNFYIINGEYPEIKRINRNALTISSFGSFLFEQGAIVGPWLPNLCVNSQKTIIAVDYVPFKTRIMMIDLDGNFIKEIIKPGTGLDFSGHVFVETNKGDSIYLYNTSRVYIYDKEGNHLSDFSVWQTSDPLGDDHQFMYTSGLAIDDNNNVFTIDPPGNIVNMYSPDGVFVRNFYAETPYSVTTDSERGLIYISGERNIISVYDYEGNAIEVLQSRGTQLGEFLLPTDIAIDPLTHNLFINDVRNQSIQEAKFIYEPAILSLEDPQKSIEFYPNPVSISFTLKTEKIILKMKAIDALGQEQDMTWSENQIDASKLKSGICIVLVYFASEVYTFKIMKH
ncbi:MAG: hypothetical protein ABI663_07735 [Chryseolinea sp.]